MPPAATPATTASSTPDAQERAALPSWSGVWSKQWYAVCSVGDFDASGPQRFELLGKQLVIWRAADGAWGCLEDRCPHRAVPLSGAWAGRALCRAARAALGGLSEPCFLQEGGQARVGGRRLLDRPAAATAGSPHCCLPLPPPRRGQGVV